MLGRRRAERAISKAWSVAAAELGIRVDAPAIVELGDGGPTKCLALVHDFGSRHGMALLPLARFDGELLSSEPDPDHPTLSFLGDGYTKFDRAHFVETLNDWGWRGEGSPPEWYVGRAE